MKVERVVVHLPVIRELPSARREEIAAAATIVDLQAGDNLWERGDAADGFYFLIVGRVRLLADPRAVRNLIVDIVDTPNAVVCTPAVCLRAAYCCHAQSAQKTTLLFVPSGAVLEDDLSPMATLLLQQASQRAMTLCRRLREVSGDKVQQRVATVLWRLADEQGTSRGRLMRLPTATSRRDLAGLSGCATETLIRELAGLEGLGLVVRDGRALLVDIEALTHFIQDERAGSS